jgi:PAS domain S-box-containing protein
MNILLIEDNPDHAELIREILSDAFEYVNFTTIADGKEALGMILDAGSEFDIALLDYHIPQVSGIDILQKAIAHNINLPIIVLTADSRIETAVEAMSNGAFDFLPKGSEVFKNIPAKIKRVTQIYQEIQDKRKYEQALKASEEKYRDLFENSPVALWQQDYSAIHKKINKLRQEGITDLENYLVQNPWFVKECLSLVKINEINKATLKLYNATAKEELTNNLETVFSEESLKMFRNTLIKIANNETYISGEDINYTLSGKKIYVMVTWTVMQGFEADYSKVFVSVMDITGKKMSEKALYDSRQRYQQLFDKAIDGICITDFKTGIILNCNEAFLELTEYTQGELIGQTEDFLFLANSKKDTFFESFYMNHFSGIYRDSEAKITTKSGKIKDVEIVEGCIEINNKRYIQNLYRDITEKKQVERERKISIKLMGQLNAVNNSYDLIKSVTDMLYEWTGCGAVGIRLKEGNDFPYFVTRGFPKEFVKAENSLCLLDENGKIVKDGEGNPVLECMCGNVLTGNFDPDKPFFTKNGSFWTNSTSRLLNNTTEEDRQARTRNRCHGEGYESVVLIPLKVSEQTIGLLQMNDTKKGVFTKRMIRLLENTASQIAIALSQRKAQEALRENEEKQRLLLDYMVDHIFMLSLDGTYIASNDKVKQLGFKNGNEVLGYKLKDIYKGQVLQIYETHLKKVIDGKKPVKFEHPVNEGENQHYHIDTLYPIFKDNKLISVGGICRDITKQKQSQEKLEHLNKVLRAISSIDQLIVHEKERPKLIKKVCKELTKTRGYNSAWIILFENNELIDFAEAGIGDVFNDLIEQLKTGYRNECIKRTFEQPAVIVIDDVCETCNDCPLIQDTRKMTMSVRLEHNNKIYGVLCVHLPKEIPASREELELIKEIADDIAFTLHNIQIEKDHERAQLAIKENEERFRLLFENMRNGGVIYEAFNKGEDFVIKSFNKAAEKIEKVKKRDVLSQKVTEVFPGIEAFGLLDVLRNVWKTGKPEDHPVSEYKDGRIRGWRDNYVYKLPSGDVVAIYTDETERKKALDAIRISEEKFRNFFNSTNDAIVITDMDTRFVEVNKTALEILGYTYEEILKLKTSQVIAPAYHDLINDRLEKLKQGQGTRNMEVELVKKDGTSLFIEMNSKPIEYFNDQNAVLSVVRDITERKKLEKKILDTMIEAEERERQRVAEDLHDEMGPYLSTIKLYASELQKKKDKETKIKMHTQLNEIIDQSIKKIKELSNNLMPNILTDYGLIKAIESLSKKISESGGIAIQVNSHNTRERYKKNLEITLYRIINELINNTLKHAQANKISINFEENNDKLLLIYTDNGKGFDMNKQLNKNKGLGLQNIANRLRSLNGNYTFYSNKGQGIRYNIEIKDIGKYYE